MHQVGERFIEEVTDVSYDPKVAEALDQAQTVDPIHLAQDMRFKAAIRGWTHRAHQLRATTLLNFNSISLPRDMQEKHDLILLPAEWWPSAAHTIEPGELGWWYKISEPVRFIECATCGNRICTGMQTESTGCRKCPTILRPITPGRSKQHGGKLPAKKAFLERRRSPRLRNRALAEVSYCEVKDDEDFDSDNGLGQDLQQGYLCASADPRRVGGPGGEPTVIHIEELRTLLRAQQTLDDQSVWLTTAQAGFPVLADTQEVQSDRDQLMGSPVARFLHPAISSFIQERW